MRFIHLADSHLASFRTFDSSLQATIREKSWESFENILLSNRDVDFALIAGDLFERNFFTARDFDKLFSIIDDFGKDIYYVTGNHDYFDSYNSVFFNNKPNKLHIFTDNKLSIFEREDVRIYGISYTDRINNYSFPYDIKLDNNYFNILLAHGDYFEGQTNYLDLNPNKLSNFDYVALGHIHMPINEGNCYYPSSIEPFNKLDTSGHGYIIYDEGRVERVDSALMKFYNFTIDARDFESENAIVSYINDRLEERINFVYINLASHDDLNINFIKKDINASFVEIKQSEINTYDKLINLYPDSILAKFAQSFEGKDDLTSRRAYELGMDAIVRTKR